MVPTRTRHRREAGPPALKRPPVWNGRVARFRNLSDTVVFTTMESFVRERWQSGLMRRLAKPLSPAFRAPRVRIPSSPFSLAGPPVPVTERGRRASPVQIGSFLRFPGKKRGVRGRHAASERAVLHPFIPYLNFIQPTMSRSVSELVEQQEDLESRLSVLRDSL